MVATMGSIAVFYLSSDVSVHGWTLSTFLVIFSDVTLGWSDRLRAQTATRALYKNKFIVGLDQRALWN